MAKKPKQTTSQEREESTMLTEGVDTMAKASGSYAEFMAQIEELKQKAEEARQTEISDVVDEIKDKIHTYGLTASDLGFHIPTRGRVAKGESMVKPKYRDPATGMTWSGRGMPPIWIREYETQGKHRREFEIKE